MAGASLELAPLLSLAGELVGGVAEIALDVPRNRNQARALSEECGSLLSAIKQASESVDQASDSVIKLLCGFVRLLRKIQSSMVQWKDLGLWKSFGNQDVIAKNIADYGRELRSLARIGYEAEFQSRDGGPGQAYPWKVGNQARYPNLDEGRYEESERQDRREAVLVFALPDIGSYLDELEGAKDRGEAEDAKQEIGHFIEDLGEDDDLKPDERAQLKRNRSLISGVVGQLPKSLRVPPGMIEFYRCPVAGSTRSDIYSGTLLTQAVAIKKSKLWELMEGYVELILKEAKVWRSACEADPNEEYLLQLIGVSFHDESCMIISRWMEERDLLTYLRKMGDGVDRRRIVRRIAKGLEILHGHKPTPIAHGRIQAWNIMINHKGDPLLGDFGLSKNIHGVSIKGDPGLDFMWWSPPEILAAEISFSLPPTADIYSFAMTVLEVGLYIFLQTS
ncbi:kinase-like protein [Schizopora paradoxa]|uniref:Kinase-like protein n=1 Tax=Schizopora paradoxa TaxID=27342 RepID=A0A0H2RGN5_9AGAM|nr:kinase-like protein [Schizopora paradoxa]